MSPLTTILFAGDDSWRIASAGAVDELRIDRETSANEIAAAVAAKLRERQYQGEGVLLALPSSWCMAASISTQGLPRHDRAAMRFRLEEKLPLAAEAFTADFIEHDESALGVCVANDRVVPIVKALEAAGVVVQSMSPAALLAAQHYGWGGAATTVLLWREGASINLITRAGDVPDRWSLASDQLEAVRFELDVLLAELEGSQQAVAIDLDQSPIIEELAAVTGLAITAVQNLTIEQTVIAIAPDVLSGRVKPWVELRRDALSISDPLRVIRRPMNAALTAAAAVCLVLAAVFFYRSVGYDHLAQSYETQLANEFKLEFPNWPVPPNVRATVESERKKLTQTSSSALPAAAQGSALRVLHDVLSRVPPDSSLQMDRMAFNETTAELGGRSKAYDGADVLVAAARGAGLEVPPPQMEKLADGSWRFTIRASKPGKSPVAAGGQE
ncbi:MAG: hypothetical protein JWN40_5874 [Phycisphaerales bacterium]|nr:hypothetical protein [Phycisphaerales bacterium]